MRQFDTVGCLREESSLLFEPIAADLAADPAHRRVEEAFPLNGGRSAAQPAVETAVSPAEAVSPMARHPHEVMYGVGHAGLGGMVIMGGTVSNR